METVNCTILTQEWINEHELRKSKLHIKDTWNDKLANKTGLNSIYISNTITDIMQLRAEKEPNVQLNYSNPVFEKYTVLYNNLMKTFLKNPGSPELKEQYYILLQYVKTYSNQNFTICYWKNYIPDIRALDTLQECFSWLYMYLNIPS